MSKYIIPYKSKTRNPNARNMVYFIQNRQEPIQIVLNKDIDEKDDDNLFKTMMSDGKYTYIIKRNKDFDFNKYRDCLLELNVGILSTQVLYSLTPEPDFLYEYNDFEVECKYCGGVFDWKKLLTDYYYDCYGGSCNTVCPECGDWYCCEIEFEK